ncbi:MAG: hypothetical protein IJQ39_08760 [Thermoguttaceae bacterium]|nr:hypothetical protein [Thermoguttaceae bacterium]
MSCVSLLICDAAENVLWMLQLDGESRQANVEASKNLENVENSSDLLDHGCLSRRRKLTTKNTKKKSDAKRSL